MKNQNFMYLVIFVIFLLLLVSLVTFFLTRRKQRSDLVYKIWCFWDNEDNMPESVKLGIESWKKFNPNYELTLITKQNYKTHITLLRLNDSIANHPNFNTSLQKFSDLVRLTVLSEHGGVYVDSTSICGEPLDNWLFKQNKDAEFSGFYLLESTQKEQFPVVDNWFLACKKNSEFIKRWRDEILEELKFNSTKDYVHDRLHRLGVDPQSIYDVYYLATNIAAQKVIQVDKYPLEKLELRIGEEGPFKYIKHFEKDNSELGLRMACEDKELRKPFMKIMGFTRRVFDEKLKDEFSNNKCKWV